MDPPLPPESDITFDYIGRGYTPMDEDMDDRYSVPTLEELGTDFKRKLDLIMGHPCCNLLLVLTGFDTDGLMTAVWRGGETEALTRLERHLERKAWVASFGRPKMTPQSLLASQTGLSPYLRFGCLSVRLFHQQLTNLYKKVILTLIAFVLLFSTTGYSLCNKKTDQESTAAAVAARPSPLARIFLLRRYQQSEFRQNGRKSNLRPDTLGHERRSIS